MKLNLRDFDVNTIVNAYHRESETGPMYYDYLIVLYDIKGQLVGATAEDIIEGLFENIVIHEKKYLLNIESPFRGVNNEFLYSKLADIFNEGNAHAAKVGDYYIIHAYDENIECPFCIPVDCDRCDECNKVC